MTDAEYKALMQNEVEFRTDVLDRLVELEGLLVKLFENQEAIAERNWQHHLDLVERFLAEEKERWVGRLREMMGDDDDGDWWKKGEEPPL